MNYNNLFSQNLIKSVLSLILGIVLVIIDGNSLANIIFLILGVLIIIANIQKFIESCKNLKYKTSVSISQFITDLLIIILGILLLILQSSISTIIGVLILAFIIFQIIIDRKNWKAEVIYHLPLIILSIALLIFSFGGIIDLLLTVFGVILIATSIINFVYLFTRGRINND